MSNDMDLVKILDHDSGVLQITLHRPQALNALNAALLEKLNEIFLAVKANNEIKALLITGEGKAFCAGADINQLEKLNGQEGAEFARRGQKIFRTLEQLGKPSLAAINGFALGGGCELAMAASLRIASEAAVFGLPEAKLGVIPGFGGTQRLSRLVGKGRALDLCLTGRTIKAIEALNIGLVSEVLPSQELLARAMAILENLIKLGSIALRSIMTVVDRGYDITLEDALELEAVHFGLCCATRDKQEGVKAFLEKRSAEFCGE
jgi:enoyl-CoA hydratase